MTLRDGVKFHDGSPFSADDVKATLDRLLKIGQGQSYLVADITEVTVVDPHTVKITTKAPNVFLAGNLSRIEIMSAKDIARHAADADKGEAWFGQNANGTGPYQFVSWTRGAQIELKRNAAWWGEFPKGAFDRVIDRFVADGANRARGLEGGEYDLANFVPRDDARRIGKSSGFHVVEGNNLWAQHGAEADRQCRLSRGAGPRLRLQRHDPVFPGRRRDRPRAGAALVPRQPGERRTGDHHRPRRGQGGARQVGARRSRVQMLGAGRLPRVPLRGDGAAILGRAARH